MLMAYNAGSEGLSLMCLQGMCTSFKELEMVGFHLYCRPWENVVKCLDLFDLYNTSCINSDSSGIVIMITIMQSAYIKPVLVGNSADNGHGIKYNLPNKLEIELGWPHWERWLLIEKYKVRTSVVTTE